MKKMITVFFVGTLALLALTLSGCSPIAPPVTTLPPRENVSPPPIAHSQIADVYKGFFPGASSPGLDTTLYLNPNGSLRLISDYQNDEPAMIEVGGWQAEDDAVILTLTGSLSGTVENKYDQSAVFTLTVDSDVLTASSWIGPWYRFSALAQGMSPAYDSATAGQFIQDRNFLGYYKMFAPSATCCGRDVTLLLGISDLARLTTNYLNDQPPIVETGTWSLEDGKATVSLTGRADGTVYAEPDTLVFDVEDGMLTATSWDVSRYGDNGLSFYAFPPLAMASVSTPK